MIKKRNILLIMSMLVGNMYTNAQHKSGTRGYERASVVTFNSQLLNNGFDTLYPPSFLDACVISNPQQAIVLIGSDQGGYGFGNNGYGDLECAQKVTTTGDAAVTEVLVQFGYRTKTAGITSVNIYGINPTTKAPDDGNLLGSSDPIVLNDISTGIVAFKFNPPVSVNSMTFAASVVYPTEIGDTIGITSTQFGCSGEDSLSWQKWNENNVQRWVSVITSDNQKRNLDIMIIPVVSTAVGVGTISKNGLTLHTSAYPNPAGSFVAINYSIAQAEKVSVDVYDWSGKQVATFLHNRIEQAGKHELKADVTNLAAGTYFYSVSTESSRLMNKFTVVR